jgi:hypothetical protein
LLGSLGLAFPIPCIADATIFAVPPLTEPGRPTAAVAALAEIMGKIQMRHLKLWYAIKAKSSDLLTYEIDHVSDTFATAVILYRNIPVERIAAASKPLGAIEVAAKRPLRR